MQTVLLECPLPASILAGVRAASASLGISVVPHRDQPAPVFVPEAYERLCEPAKRYSRPRVVRPACAEKQRYALADASAIAETLLAQLAPGCERIAIAGSIRRGKSDVGDMELVYIPRGADADGIVEDMEFDGTLEIRGGYGPANKFMRHIDSGIPLDLFATTADAWASYLLFRTGSAQTNMRIATRAIKQGARWHPFKGGFSRGDEWIATPTEESVFAFVGLDYVEPAKR